MRRFVAVFFILFLLNLDSIGQSYVDSGIQHYVKKEYPEALEDFDSAIDLKEILPAAAIGKLHYYLGMTWLAIEQRGSGSFSEKSAAMEAYQNLRIVSDHSDQWDEQVAKAYRTLSELLNDRAQDLEKGLRKADGLKDKLSIHDERIRLLKIVDEMNVVFGSRLNLARANKKAGDLIFEEDPGENLQIPASTYYEVAMPLYEEARYDDPFSKEIISEMIVLAERLADQERLEEYEKLLELAGG